MAKRAGYKKAGNYRFNQLLFYFFLCLFVRMAAQAEAPLSGEEAYFINEVEIHPGYYVDWDEAPDETIEPLAEAYGEYLVELLCGPAPPAPHAQPPAGIQMPPA